MHYKKFKLKVSLSEMFFSPQLPFDFTWKMLKDAFNSCGESNLNKRLQISGK